MSSSGAAKRAQERVSPPVSRLVALLDRAVDGVPATALRDTIAFATSWAVVFAAVSVLVAIVCFGRAAASGEMRGVLAYALAGSVNAALAAGALAGFGVLPPRVARAAGGGRRRAFLALSSRVRDGQGVRELRRAVPGAAARGAQVPVRAVRADEPEAQAGARARRNPRRRLPSLIRRRRGERLGTIARGGGARRGRRAASGGQGGEGEPQTAPARGGARARGG